MSSSIKSKLFLGPAFILVLTILLATQPVQAGVVNTWTGNGDGFNWSDGANWSLGDVYIDDQLKFNNSTEGDTYVTNNDFHPTYIDRLIFSGSAVHDIGLFGNKVFLRRGVVSKTTNNNFNLVGHKIILDGPNSFVTKYPSMLALDADINVNKNKLSLYANGTGNYIGLMSGSNIYGKGGEVVIKGKDKGKIYGFKGSEVNKTLTITKGGYYEASNLNRKVRVIGDGMLQADGCLEVGSLIVKSGGYIRAYAQRSQGCGYSKISVNGNVTLNDARLYFSPTRDFSKAKGDKFAIIKNDGVDAIRGTFKGYPEGRKFVKNGYLFRISYRGGTGNDVVITRLSN